VNYRAYLPWGSPKQQEGGNPERAWGSGKSRAAFQLERASLTGDDANTHYRRDEV